MELGGEVGGSDRLAAGLGTGVGSHILDSRGSGKEETKVYGKEMNWLELKAWGEEDLA